MPTRLRNIADRAELDDRLTVRVVPFESDARPGMFCIFTLLEFDGQLPDVLYLEAAREEDDMITGNVPPATKYAEDFEQLLFEACLSRKIYQSYPKRGGGMS